MKDSFDQQLFQQLPIVGILRGYSEAQVQQMVPIYLDAGFTTLEVTMNTEGAARMIKQMIMTYGDKMNIGAGSVRDLSELETALAAGARFIVSPIVEPEVCDACRQQGVPFFPGAYTPSEIWQAWKLGATAVKVFPMVTGGLEHLKAVKAPLEMIPLLPTGGVNADNLASFFSAGIYGAGLGGALFPKKAIQDGNWSVLRQQLQSVALAYHSWKQQQR